MSINITVHGNRLDKLTGKNILCDPERERSEKLADLRKQRLEQVRQQSKELAQNIRQNVGAELKKQQRYIEEQKRKELLEWRERALAEAEEKRKKSLNAFGEAHRAALDEREKEKKREKAKRKNDAVAQQRGKEAIRKEKQGAAKQVPVSKKPASQPPAAVRPEKCDKSPSKVTRPAANSLQDDASSSADSSILSISEDEDSSSSSSVASSSSLQRNKTVIMNIGTDSETSISMQDSHDASNRHFLRTKSKADETVIQKPSYNAQDYRQPDTASEASTSLDAPRPKQFTQIRELVQKRQSKLSSLNALDLPATTTEPSVSLTPKSCLKSKPQPQTVVDPAPTRISKPPTTETTKTSLISSQSKPETSNSVQFYDYDNKYTKAYEPRHDAVKSIAKSSTEMPSAMENARVEVEQQEKQQKVAEELRKKSDERGENAIERERIRRECDMLTEKLNSINRDQPLIREIDGRGATNVFTQTKMQKDAAVRQKKMTTDFEDILKRPVVITCPEVKRKPQLVGEDKTTTSAPTTINVGNLGAMKDVPRNFDNISTSDSGASILLDYINRQSEQVSQDIKECDNSRTLEDLSGLLRKINGLRGHIVDEIDKCKARKEQSNIEELKALMSCVNGLREERATILNEEMKNIEQMRNHLDKRQKFITEKEKRMERKLRKIAEKISVKSDDVRRDETDHIIKVVATDKPQSTGETKVEISKPIEILIRLSNELSQKSGKSPYKSPRKRSSLIADQMHPRRKKSAPVKHRPLESRQQTPRKQLVENSPAKSRTSTSYRSIPEVINTNLGAYLASPPKPKPKDDKPQDDSEKQMREKLKDVKSKPVPEQTKPRETAPIVRADEKKDLDPVLLHYIQRLLVMSRSSIDMLGVSSSDVATPSSSIIDRSSNMSNASSLLCDSDRMQKLSEHVADYYNFINNMQDSIRSINSSKSSEKSSESQSKENVWCTTLKDAQHNHVTKKMLRSILKKTSKGGVRKNVKSVETQVTDISKSEKSVEVQLTVEPAKPAPMRQSSSSSKADLPDGLSERQYEEQSQNCVKRIAELENMIEKIRQEKRKMLELTLTSGSSDTGRNSTEYMDFPDAARAAMSSDLSGKNVGNQQQPVRKVQVESERGQLERNKLTGVSRDSGISLSRPVTALDSHDSQDGRTSYDKQSPELRPTSSAKETHKLFVHEPKTVQSDSKPPKHSKPPLTIARYTPELVDELPQELSTIAEVETPATSRLNASIPEKKIPNLSVQLSESLKAIKTFPTYEEYIASRNLEATRHINEDSDSVLHVEFSSKDMTNISTKGNLEYKDFPSFKTYLRSQGHDPGDTQYQNITSTQPSPDESENTNTSFQQFPTHQSYAKMLGASDLLDSQSIAAVSLTDGSTASKKSEDSESTETLPDVVAELKKRNLLQHSFRNEVKTTDSDTSSSTQQRKGDKEQAATVPANSESKKTPKKKKEPSTSRPEDLTGIEPLAATSLSQTSTSDLSEPLEKELESMGLKWASRMLKKSHQSMDLGSTSSSFTYEQRRHKTPKKSSKKPSFSSSVRVETVLRAAEKSLLQPDSDQSSDVSGGRAFDLKAFFTKELEKRATTTSLSSSSSIDDSLTSQFLKSILGSANSTPIVSLSKRTTPHAQDQRHHTSTPVHQKKSSPSSKSSPDTSKLFSMESAISSVRLNSSSSNEKESIHVQDRDALSASHLKLNVDSKRSKSSKHDNNDKNLS